MNERIKRLREALRIEKFPICTEKAQIIIESSRKNEGRPIIIRRAQATADYLDKKTIFIEDDELIIGNIASRHMGMECGSYGPAWPDDDFDDLLAGGTITVSDEDRRILRDMDSYWQGQGRTQDERQGSYYDKERLWPFMKKGFLCPPWQRKDQGRGQGAAGVGWGLGMGPACLIVPDFGKVVHEGLGKVVSDAEEELKNLRYVDADSVYKADFLKATLIAFPAIIRLAKRFSDLALKMAGEETDEKRKKELEVIAETCSRVPEHPARTFREGIQSFFFYWIMTASGATPGGRFDQYMYPLYKEDIEKGLLNDEEVLELLECLRLKIMQLNFVGGGKGQREKWAGMARWHNFIIGGCDKNGRDATNPLSYLLLEAARDCQTPHPTLTVRVSQNTPKEFMLKALEVVKTGIGMPAFISEDSYLKFLVGEGVPIEEAREFAIAGCLDVQLPGKSRNNAFGMFIVPMVLELALNNGMDPKTGELLGVETGNFEDFKTYDEFLDAFKIQLRHIMGEISEEHNILLIAQRDAFPDVVHSALLDNGIKLGKDGLNRQMLFENGSAINMVGMCNTVDSLAAIKKLVFDEKLVAAHELKAALAANWEGYEKIHKLCLESPKFGNNDPYVDMIATDLWDSYSEIARTFTSVFGKPVLPTAISITAHVPGGAMTGATPDGRYAGETFADGSISPAQGKDVNGPLAVLQSAMKINQDKFMATLLNMKFHPSALKNESDLEKLGSMIRTYLTNGGKHIQFNIVSRETLIAAKADKRKYRDLIVRVAGYSAYFVSLTPKVQDEIIARSEQRL